MNLVWSGARGSIEHALNSFPVLFCLRVEERQRRSTEPR